MTNIFNFRPKKVAKRRLDSMPSADVIDVEFLQMHKRKIQKMIQQAPFGVIQLSTITKNHLCPQIGNSNTADDARKFLLGMEANGLGKFQEQDAKRGCFTFPDKEQLTPGQQELFKQLELISYLS